MVLMVNIRKIDDLKVEKSSYSTEEVKVEEELPKPPESPINVTINEEPNLEKKEED